MSSEIPIIFTLFGATGDLAQRKIIPALLGLYKNGQLPKNYKVIAFSRRPWTDLEYHRFIEPSLISLKKYSQQEIQDFLQHVVYVQGTFDSVSGFELLKEKIEHLEKNTGTEVQKLFYLAVQPEFYIPIARNMSSVGLNEKSRILIEKPFGHSLASAVELEIELEKSFTENQIYRIDHYLGKAGLWRVFETRAHEEIFENNYSHESVKEIRIKFFEKIGIEGRGEFYESVGTLRDVVQNHELEMLAFALMDIPKPEERSAEDVIEARTHALRLLNPVSASDIQQAVIRGQYEGYLKEEDVRPDSQTETYIHITTTSRNPRFEGVDLILEAGKALGEKRSEIEIIFKNGESKVFPIDEQADDRDAYDVVIDAAIRADKKYFVSMDEVSASWTFADSVLRNISDIPLRHYAQGSMPKL